MKYSFSVPENESFDWLTNHLLVFCHITSHKSKLYSERNMVYHSFLRKITYSINLSWLKSISYFPVSLYGGSRYIMHLSGCGSGTFSKDILYVSSLSSISRLCRLSRLCSLSRLCRLSRLCSLSRLSRLCRLCISSMRFLCKSDVNSHLFSTNKSISNSFSNTRVYWLFLQNLNILLFLDSQKSFQSSSGNMQYHFAQYLSKLHNFSILYIFINSL